MITTLLQGCRPATIGLGLVLCAAGPLAAQQDTTRAPAPAPAAPPPADTIRPPVAPVRVPPPLPHPWRFGVEIGFTDIAGNRDLQLFNGVYTMEHQRTTAYIFNARFEARYGRADTIVAVSNSAFRLRFDWRPREHVSPFLGFDVESDRIKKIDTRIKGGAGVNINIAPREDRRTTLALGLIAEIEERFHTVTPRSLSDWRWHFRFATLQPLNGHVVFESNAKFQPSTRRLGDHEAGADLAMRVTITRTLAFRTRYEWRRDSTPAPGVSSQDDRSMTFSLLMSW